MARPKILSPTDRWLSMVWIRLIGAIRQCTENQPDLVYRAWSVTSQRCTLYRQRGITIACNPASTAVATMAARHGAGKPLIAATATSATTATAPLTAALAVQ